jgi:hypothetical protein
LRLRVTVRVTLRRYAELHERRAGGGGVDGRVVVKGNPDDQVPHELCVTSEQAY